MWLRGRDLNHDRRVGGDRRSTTKTGSLYPLSVSSRSTLPVRLCTAGGQEHEPISNELTVYAKQQGW